jgi:pseudoazurin
VRVSNILFAVTAILFANSPAAARDWRVDMVNRGANGSMDFTPAFLKIAPGDAVRFVAKDKTHNVESIRNMMPAGASPFQGAINQDVTVKFSRAGLYGYKCLPHTAMGMVGLIQVGSAVNRPAIVANLGSLPPLARARMTKFLQLAK